MWERSPDLDNRHQEMPPTLVGLITVFMINFIFSFPALAGYYLTGITDTSIVPAYTRIPETYTNPSLLFTTFRTIGALGLVLIILFGFVWLLRRFRFSGIPGRGGVTTPLQIKVLGKAALSPKQAIYIVEVPDHVLVLGVTGENITCLTEIRGAEEQGKRQTRRWGDTETRRKIEPEKGAEGKRKDFSQYLQSFISGGRQGAGCRGAERLASEVQRSRGEKNKRNSGLLG